MCYEDSYGKEFDFKTTQPITYKLDFESIVAIPLA